MSSISPPKTPPRTFIPEEPGAPQKGGSGKTFSFSHPANIPAHTSASDLSDADPEGDLEEPYRLLDKKFTELLHASEIIRDGIRSCVNPAWVIQSHGPPPLYNHSTLKGTRAPTRFDIGLEQEKQLKNTVYAPDLVRQLMKSMAAKLDHIRINPNDPSDQQTLNTILPWEKNAGLPPIIMSEQDTVDRVKALILRPARGLVHAVLKSEAGGQLNDDQVDFFPCITSAPQLKVCPDFMSSVLKSSNKRPEVIRLEDLKTVLCGEIKTHGVLPFMENPLYQLQSKAGIKGITCPPGSEAAHGFNWPTLVGENLPKSGRILVQIWSQMVAYDTNYLILSSEDCTTFAYRSQDHPNTLYLSPPYRGHRNPVHFLTACYLLHAVQASKGLHILPDLSLPIPDTSYRTAQHEADLTPGACNILKPGHRLKTTSGRAEVIEDIDPPLFSDDSSGSEFGHDPLQAIAAAIFEDEGL